MKAKKKKATLTCLSCHKHHKHRSVIALLPQGLDCDGCSRQSCSHILKTKQDRSTAYYGTLLGSGIATAFAAFSSLPRRPVTLKIFGFQIQNMCNY